MNPFLTNCTLTGGLANPAPDFLAVAQSLGYQARSLGFAVHSQAQPMQADLSFHIQSQGGTSVQCTVSRWHDVHDQTPVTESILQAACGLMSVHGRATGRAQALGLNYVSTLSAALALQGGIAATLGQLRGLPMMHSHVAMSAAALLSVGQYIAGATAEELPEKLIPAQIIHPDCPPFVSADGVVFELETLDAKPWLAFWTELGIDKPLAGKGWTAFLLRYAKAIAPLPNEFINAVASVPYGYINELAQRYNVSVCPVRTLQERATDADCQRVFSQGPWAFSREDLTTALPLRTGSRDNLPLSGLTVIESCRRIQGPLAGHLLALLGAEVIRIEPVGGDPLRGMPPMADGVSARFDALNRHKTIREIDIKSSAGKAEIVELVRDADVFLHNWAEGKGEEMQLGASDLQAINPSLIYAHAAGWATDNTEHTLLGTDFITQAYSGVAQQIAQQSGKLGGSLFTVLDVLGGVVAAQGITAALLERQLNNKRIQVKSSLISAATLLCAEPLQRIYSPDTNEPTQTSLINSVYATQQGLIAIECVDEASVTRLFAALDKSDQSQQLAKLLLSKTAAQWLTIFQAVNIPVAVVVEDLTDLLNNPLLQPCLTTSSYTQVISPWSFS
ncbi:MAG: CoA transferase [Methylococcales bacterium]|nr:CoA transferase [Methylococcales bacterium]